MGRDAAQGAGALMAERPPQGSRPAGEKGGLSPPPGDAPPQGLPPGDEAGDTVRMDSGYRLTVGAERQGHRALGPGNRLMPGHALLTRPPFGEGSGGDDAPQTRPWKRPWGGLSGTVMAPRPLPASSSPRDLNPSAWRGRGEMNKEQDSSPEAVVRDTLTQGEWIRAARGQVGTAPQPRRSLCGGRVEGR